MARTGRDIVGIAFSMLFVNDCACSKTMGHARPRCPSRVDRMRGPHCGVAAAAERMCVGGYEGVLSIGCLTNRPMGTLRGWSSGSGSHNVRERRGGARGAGGKQAMTREVRRCENDLDHAMIANGGDVMADCGHQSWRQSSTGDGGLPILMRTAPNWEGIKPRIYWHITAQTAAPGDSPGAHAIGRAVPPRPVRDGRRRSSCVPLAASPRPLPP
jgi:hypothetical protein